MTLVLSNAREHTKHPHKLRDIWRSRVSPHVGGQPTEEVTNVVKWVSNTTLDVIGLAGLFDVPEVENLIR